MHARGSYFAEKKDSLMANMFTLTLKSHVGSTSDSKDNLTHRDEFDVLKPGGKEMDKHQLKVEGKPATIKQKKSKVPQWNEDLRSIVSKEILNNISAKMNKHFKTQRTS